MDGEVTLSGTVPDRQVKYQVEELVERCGGIEDVTNNLRISRGGEKGADKSGSRNADEGADKGSRSPTAGNNRTEARRSDQEERA